MQYDTDQKMGHDFGIKPPWTKQKLKRKAMKTQPSFLKDLRQEHRSYRQAKLNLSFLKDLRQEHRSYRQAKLNLSFLKDLRQEKRST